MSWYLVVMLAGNILATPVPFNSKELCEEARAQMTEVIDEGECIQAGDEIKPLTQEQEEDYGGKQ